MLYYLNAAPFDFCLPDVDPFDSRLPDDDPFDDVTSYGWCATERRTHVVAIDDIA